MATNGSEYKTVARLSDLTIQQLKATTLSTEVLLFLPNEVLRDLCWINSKYRRYIILISDIPTKSDGNMVSGAICGYHALKREFLFGEYQTVVSLDQLESVTWKNSVQVKEILFYIQQVIETSCQSEQSRTEARLYQEVTRWILKNKYFFELKFTNEFLEFAQKETISVNMVVQ